MVIRLKIEGSLPAKANRGRIFRNSKTGKNFVYIDKDVEKKIKDAELQISHQYKGKPIEYPVEVNVFFFFKTKRRRDLDNIMKTLGDVLESSGVLKDDKLIFREKLEKFLGIGFDGIFIEIKPYKATDFDKVLKKFERIKIFD